MECVSNTKSFGFRLNEKAAAVSPAEKVPGKVILKRACIQPGKFFNNDTFLFAHIDNEPIALCCLSSNGVKFEKFTSEEFDANVMFSVQGPAEIHISGHIQKSGKAVSPPVEHPHNNTKKPVVTSHIADTGVTTPPVPKSSRPTPRAAPLKEVTVAESIPIPSMEEPKRTSEERRQQVESNKQTASKVADLLAGLEQKEKEQEQMLSEETQTTQDLDSDKDQDMADLSAPPAVQAPTRHKSVHESDMSSSEEEEDEKKEDEKKVEEFKGVIADLVSSSQANKATKGKDSSDSSAASTPAKSKLALPKAKGKAKAKAKSTPKKSSTPKKNEEVDNKLSSPKRDRRRSPSPCPERVSPAPSAKGDSSSESESESEAEEEVKKVEEKKVEEPEKKEEKVVEEPKEEEKVAVPTPKKSVAADSTDEEDDYVPAAREMSDSEDDLTVPHKATATKDESSSEDESDREGFAQTKKVDNSIHADESDSDADPNIPNMFKKKRQALAKKKAEEEARKKEEEEKENKKTDKKKKGKKEDKATEEENKTSKKSKKDGESKKRKAEEKTEKKSKKSKK